MDMTDLKFIPIKNIPNRFLVQIAGINFIVKENVGESYIKDTTYNVVNVAKEVSDDFHIANTMDNIRAPTKRELKLAKSYDFYTYDEDEYENENEEKCFSLTGRIIKNMPGRILVIFGHNFIVELNCDGSGKVVGIAEEISNNTDDFTVNKVREINEVEKLTAKQIGLIL